jgi:hypothetical protein
MDFFAEGLIVYVHPNQWGAVGFVFELQSSNKFQQVQVLFRFLGFWMFNPHSFRIVENSLCPALVLLLLLPIRSEGWKGGSGPRRIRGCISSSSMWLPVTTRLKSCCLLYSKFQTARFFSGHDHYFSWEYPPTLFLHCLIASDLYMYTLFPLAFFLAPCCICLWW